MTAPTLPRDTLLEAVLHDCQAAEVDVVGLHATGHRVTVEVETSEDLAALSEALLDSAPAQSGWVMGRWASVNLLDRDRPVTDVNLSIHTVGGAR